MMKTDRFQAQEETTLYFEYGDTELNYLKQKDKILGAVIEQIGHVEREVDTDLFSSVVHQIIGQQISTKALATIWQRFRNGFEKIDAEHILALDAEELQAFGISFRKVEYIRDFAKLYKLIRKYAPDAKLVWATITPVRNATQLDRFEPFNDRVAERNRRVLRFLEGKGVIINDLNAILADRPDLYDTGDGIHPNGQGTQMLATQVANTIRPLLEQ